MVSYIISRLVVLMFGTLYPAYSSYKAVKTRNVKEYVKWMMYWIVFALFTCVETIADIFASILPFYYEAKILFIIWLISPWTKGATVLYRKFVHPTLSKREEEIDEYLAQASDKGLMAIKKVGQNGLTIAANAVMTSAMKGQLTLMDQLRTYSTYYNTSPVKQLEGVPEESTEEVEEAREAQEHMMLLRSEDMTDEDEDQESPHYRNKQLRQSLESLDNRLREERDEKDSDYTEERYEHERLEQERLEQEQMEWEHQQNQERLHHQDRYKNRRHTQGSSQDDLLPPQPPRHRRSNPSKRERNFTTSLTREEFDNASNMYPEDDEEEITFKKSAQLRRPYASTENLSRRPVVRKHERNKSQNIAALDLCIPEEDSDDVKSEQYFSEKEKDTTNTDSLSKTSKESVVFGDFWAKNHREIVAKKELLSKKCDKDTVLPKESKEINAAKKRGNLDASKTSPKPAKSKKNKDTETPKQKNKPLVRTSSERSSARATRASTRSLNTKRPLSGIEITRY